MAMRRPRFAGSWYPETAAECLEQFQTFEKSCIEYHEKTDLVGGLVPHAGWMFSGRIAYNVIRELAKHQEKVQTIILFGEHLGPQSASRIITSGDWWTPLGNIKTDKEFASALAEKCKIRGQSALDYQPDNTTELQLPFIKHFFEQTQIVIVAAAPRPETFELAKFSVEIAKKLGRKIVSIGSSDLTHYGPNYGWAPHGLGHEAENWVRNKNDKQFIDAVCALDSAEALKEALDNHNACCPGAVGALMTVVQGLGAKQGLLLQYATSADVRRDDSFVGYAGIVFPA